MARKPPSKDKAAHASLPQKNNNVKERVDPLDRRLPLANQAIKPTYPEEQTHRAEPVGGASEDRI
jgi:hypothetical protein